MNKSRDPEIFFNALYGDGGRVYIWEYPSGKPVGTVSGVTAQGLCSDYVGDVWGASGNFAVYFIEHDGYAQAFLFDYGENADGCGVDPITHAVAVTNANGSITVFPNDRDPGTVYPSHLRAASYCTFDNHGNLFADGVDAQGKGQLVELANGSESLKTVRLGKRIAGVFSIQWDGSHLAVEASQSDGQILVYQIGVTNDRGTILGQTKLFTNYYISPRSGFAQFWIQGHTILMATGTNSTYRSDLQFWHYPAGGEPFKTLEAPGKLGALTVSALADR